MPVIPCLDENILQKLCDVLADTSSGLKGSEIARALTQSGITDPEPTITKRHRLFAALSQRQRSDGCANNVIAFVRAVMNPVRYVGSHEYYETYRTDVNRVLCFAGYTVTERGEVECVAAARTLTEAEERADRMRAELMRRKVHPDVLLFCRAELLDKNYFHAVFEATKSVAEKIRQKAGLIGDGAEIVDAAFGLANGVPLLALNTLQTETEQSEQKGFANLVKGMFGTFRNVTGHAPKIYWPITEQDALDLLTLVSLIHRRLDEAIRTPRLP